MKDTQLKEWTAQTVEAIKDMHAVGTFYSPEGSRLGMRLDLLISEMKTRGTWAMVSNELGLNIDLESFDFEA